MFLFSCFVFCVNNFNIVNRFISIFQHIFTMIATSSQIFDLQITLIEKQLQIQDQTY